MRLILGFPGQGSQKAKIGQALAKAYPNSAGKVFQIADETLDGLFSKIVWGSESDNMRELSATENTQPIVLATSIAVLEALKETSGFEVTARNTACLVGHSLGEFSCLVAAGSLDLVDALRLVRKRGETMQSAANKWGKVPAMSAVLGLTWKAALEIQQNCPEGLLVEATCANGKEQTVLSGCEQGIAWGIERAKRIHGAKRGLKVNVSCPFHSSVMRPAADEFAPALHAATLKESAVPICFGLDAKTRRAPGDIREALLKGMYSPVLWANAIQSSSDQFSDSGALQFREIGSDTLKFGIADVRGITYGKPVRPIPEDVLTFQCDIP